MCESHLLDSLHLSVLYLRSLLLGVSKPTGGFSLGNFYVPVCKDQHALPDNFHYTAYAEELNLKKEQTYYSDLLDALRLALKGYCII